MRYKCVLRQGHAGAGKSNDIVRYVDANTSTEAMSIASKLGSVKKSNKNSMKAIVSITPCERQFLMVEHDTMLSLLNPLLGKSPTDKAYMELCLSYAGQQVTLHTLRVATATLYDHTGEGFIQIPVGLLGKEVTS